VYGGGVGSHGIGGPTKNDTTHHGTGRTFTERDGMANQGTGRPIVGQYGPPGHASVRQAALRHSCRVVDPGVT